MARQPRRLSTERYLMQHPHLTSHHRHPQQGVAASEQVTATPGHSADVRVSRGGPVLAAAVLSAGLLLTGCASAGDSQASDSTSPTDASTESASATVSPTDSASASPSGSGSGSSGSASTSPSAGAIDLEQELPSTNLESRDVYEAYDGPPRKFTDVYHQACLEALFDGQEVPEMEPEPGQGGDLTLEAILAGAEVTEGWKQCPPQAMSHFSVPASFAVEVEANERGVNTLRIFDGNGQRIGGLSDAGSGSDSGQTELVEVLEIEKVTSSPSHDGETAYLRSMVVEGASGPQLLVDQVSAPRGRIRRPSRCGIWRLAAPPCAHRSGQPFHWSRWTMPNRRPTRACTRCCVRWSAPSARRCSSPPPHGHDQEAGLLYTVGSTPAMTRFSP